MGLWLVSGIGMAVAQAPPATAPERATVTIDGRVVDMRGEGVPAVSIRVSGRDDESELARGFADGEGYFRLPRVPAAAWHRVTASSEGRCTGVAVVAPESSSCTVTVHDAATVRGVLRNRRDEPVAAAIVRAEPRMRTLWGVLVDATTDADGRFELRGVPLGVIGISALVPGEGLAVTERVVAGDVDVALAPADEPTKTLRIVVAGMPAGAAESLRARILPYRNGSPHRFPPPWDRPQFGADGVCELAPVPESREYLVMPSAEGFVFEPTELRTKPQQQQQDPIELQFTARQQGGSDLRYPIELSDGAGAPLSGVKLVIRAVSGGLRTEVVTGADGRAVFDSPVGVGGEAVVYSADGRWVLDPPVVASDRMHDRRSSARYQFRVEPERTLAVRAVPACTVSGRVLLADGRPAAFVRVECQEEDGNRRPRWMPFAYAETDRDGRFRFANLHHDADAARICVEAPLGSATSEPFVLATPGTTVAMPDLRLTVAASIAGVVVDADGRPAPGVRVWLRDWDLERNGHPSGRVDEVVTDRAGRYRFLGVATGGASLYLLVGETHPLRPAVDPFAVEPGQAYTVDLELPGR